jgi:putative ABC transport system permease protein
MQNWDDLAEIVRGDLTRNFRRTFLTMFGLIVGSAAVVGVTSVGLAGRAYAVQQLESLGSNLVYALYDGPTPSPNDLSEQDFRDIRTRATALAITSRVVHDYATLEIRGEPYDVSLVGTDGNYARVRNIVMREGRFINVFDVQDHRKVCVISQSLAAKLYGRGRELGNLLQIESLDFKVVGVFRDVQSFSIPTELTKNAVIIPLTVLNGMDGSSRVDRIYGQAKSRALVALATRQIAHILAANHGPRVIYRVANLNAVLNVIHRVSRGLILVVVVVSAISLLVGGVGIMNIMLVTVRERRPEIGIRKAVGARPKQILDAFLLEAIAISLIGGLTGILLGAGIPFAVSKTFSVDIPISPVSAAFALIVSATIGVAFGYYPARRAARLDPIVCLREE